MTSSAPSSSARRATSAFDVSIESGMPCQALEHRHDAAQLLVSRDRLRARARRLTADVDERRALLDEPAAVLDRVGRVDERASVGETVGRDVEHPHDGGPRPALLERHLGRHGRGA